jgi:hypothetical protein
MAAENTPSPYLLSLRPPHHHPIPPATIWEVAIANSTYYFRRFVRKKLKIAEKKFALICRCVFFDVANSH